MLKQMNKVITCSGEWKEKAGRSFDFWNHVNVLHVYKDKIKSTIVEGILKVNIKRKKLIRYRIEISPHKKNKRN